MSWFDTLSTRSRRQKLDLFYKTFQPAEQTRILDVGAQTAAAGDGDGCEQFIDSYPWKDNITALNLSASHVERIKTRHPQVRAVQGDACSLPWPDAHFDIAYSNAVIEHVGDFQRQRQMAAEIMRVANHWFVTTPNRWYPFEFHLRLPLVTWLAGHSYLHAARIVRYNHLSRRYTFFNPKADFRLLSLSEMKACFPGSSIVKQRLTVMAETLIALGGRGSLRRHTPRSRTHRTLASPRSTT